MPLPRAYMSPEQVLADRQRKAEQERVLLEKAERRRFRAIRLAQAERPITGTPRHYKMIVDSVATGYVDPQALDSVPAGVAWHVHEVRTLDLWLAVPAQSWSEAKAWRTACHSAGVHDALYLYGLGGPQREDHLVEVAARLGLRYSYLAYVGDIDRAWRSSATKNAIRREAKAAAAEIQQRLMGEQVTEAVRKKAEQDAAERARMGDLPAHIRRACGTKKRYLTESDAVKGTDRAPIPQVPYPCSACGLWHTASVRKAKGTWTPEQRRAHEAFIRARSRLPRW